VNSLVRTVDQSFNEIFKAYEEKTGKKLEVTYIPVMKELLLIRRTWFLTCRDCGRLPPDCGTTPAN
jgi:hypothetical protein